MKGLVLNVDKIKELALNYAFKLDNDELEKNDELDESLKISQQ